MSLQTKLYKTVHGGRLSVEQIADAIGVGPASLYRAVNENDEFKLDVRWLEPIMRATGDTTVLDHLCERFDSVRVKLPRVRKYKARDPRAFNEIQQRFAAVMALVLEFFEQPEPSRVAEISEAIAEHLAEMAALRKAVHEYQQGDMFDD